MKTKLFEKYITQGTLIVNNPDGSQESYGQGEPVAEVYLKNDDVFSRVMLDPELRVGESYMDEEWEPGEGGLLSIFKLYFANLDNFTSNIAIDSFKKAFRGVIEMNNRLRSEQNVKHHYDIDNELFKEFLDQNMQYSCAYFKEESYDLDKAQLEKMRHIANKLLLKPGYKVLDIGCGWGGMAIFLAKNFDVHVTGLTLSDDQFNYAQEWIKKESLENKVTILKEDYREHEGQYDAIVSVGMFEHVGRPQYNVYFEQVARLLNPEGVALIHTIGRSGIPPEDTSTWIKKYIFPGGYIPSLSDTALPIENASLFLSDLEIWRLHYAKTLHEWNQRFQNKRELFKEKLGEHFCRMWEFYLISCIAAFTYGNLVVFHFQVTHKNDAVPLSRDYLYT